MRRLYDIIAHNGELLAAATSKFLANFIAREHYSDVIIISGNRAPIKHIPKIRPIDAAELGSECENIPIFGTGRDLVPRRFVQER